MYYDELDTFLNAVYDIFSFIGDMFTELFYTFFGTWNEITVNHLWFWLAWLPFILTFGAEIIFSFILSLRVGRVSLFVPWRASSYSALRLATARSGRAYTPAAVYLPFVRRGKIDKNKNSFVTPRLLSFTKSTVSSDLSNHILNKPLSSNSDKSLFNHRLDKPFVGRSNEVRRFIPRLTLIVQKFHGFKQFQVRFYGIFKTVYSQKFKKKN